MMPEPLQQKTTLPQPPQAEVSVVVVCFANIGEQRVVLEYRPDHSRPSSLRTIIAPSTIDASFFLAAQRAVWLRPQSGATASRSGGAHFRQRRIRAATSIGVSM